MSDLNEFIISIVTTITTDIYPEIVYVQFQNEKSQRHNHNFLLENPRIHFCKNYCTIILKTCNYRKLYYSGLDMDKGSGLDLDNNDFYNYVRNSINVIFIQSTMYSRRKELSDTRGTQGRTYEKSDTKAKLKLVKVS